MGLLRGRREEGNTRPQTRAFILHPVGLPLPDDAIIGAEQVHGVLSGWRQRLQGGERAGGPAS